MTFIHADKVSQISLSTVCPKCGKIARYDKTMLAGPLFHHVYKCVCGALIGCPTVYAKCKKFGIIAKDLVANDCLMCPIPKAEKLNPEKDCPYYLDKIDYKEMTYNAGKLREKEVKIIKHKDDD